MQDWLSLFDFQNTRRHTYYYNHETRYVDQPCRYSAPCPVLWILARFHPRHIWCGKSLPNVVNFKASLIFFANRKRWRWFFSSQAEKAVLNLCPIPWQNQSVHAPCCSFSRHVDLEFKKLPHRSFLSRILARLPVTDHFATKSLSSMSVLRLCPRVVLKLLRMTKMEVTPLLTRMC